MPSLYTIFCVFICVCWKSWVHAVRVPLLQRGDSSAFLTLALLALIGLILWAALPAPLLAYYSYHGLLQTLTMSVTPTSRESQAIFSFRLNLEGRLSSFLWNNMLGAENSGLPACFLSPSTDLSIFGFWLCVLKSSLLFLWHGSCFSTGSVFCLLADVVLNFAKGVCT